MKKLLFIHGSGSTAASWQFQTSDFAGSEAVSLPGHPEGRSCDSVQGYADWLRGYIDRQGYKDVVLAGHSLGGAIAIDYALRYSGEIRALILVGTGARLRVRPSYLASCEEGIQDQETWMRNWEPLYARVLAPLRKKLLDEKRQVGPVVQLNDLVCCDRFDVMTEIGRIDIPTLVICGTEDEMTPPKYSDYLVRGICGARLVMIDGGTHMAMAEKPREVNRAIEDFLESL